MVMAEVASQRLSCIAWSCPVVVVVAAGAGNCATRSRRLAAYEVQNERNDSGPIAFPPSELCPPYELHISRAAHLICLSAAVSNTIPDLRL